MVVLDTCALIEAFNDNPSFSRRTLNLIEKGAYLLSISFAEIACKVKLGKLEMSVSPRSLYQEIKQIKAITLVDIGADEWIESIDLLWNDNKDPVDRLIVSFAHKNNISIVTSDKKIKVFYKKVIW